MSDKFKFHKLFLAILWAINLKQALTKVNNSKTKILFNKKKKLIQNLFKNQKLKIKINKTKFINFDLFDNFA